MKGDCLRSRLSYVQLMYNFREMGTASGLGKKKPVGAFGCVGIQEPEAPTGKKAFYIIGMQGMDFSGRVSKTPIISTNRRSRCVCFFRDSVIWATS